ncbi:MAG: hypothetical protein QNJ77_01860 [Acidimicrobiia bacterium]|nr:hypothetical protein [Acidimicrobiia bacterium]
MSPSSTRSQLWGVAVVTFSAALLLFIITIVIGILNGLDWVEFSRDETVTHLHAGTLGWITLALGGVAFLMFTDGRNLSADEIQRARVLSWSLIAAVAIYVAAFYVGDSIWDDRIQRPIGGTLLFVVVIWFFVWLWRNNAASEQNSIARLGVMLAWVSLLIGAVFGILLGYFTAKGEIPGLDNDTATAIADAHPPAMVIGYLILAGMAVIEWTIRDDLTWAESRLGAAQMWILFIAGVVVNIAFISGLEEELLGPANLLMIIGVLFLVWRSRAELAPSGWRDAGTGLYPRFASLHLLVYLVLGTILIARVVSGAMDFDALTESERGFVLTFDHVMFIGVMTNALFGVIAMALHGLSLQTVDRVLLWGGNIGIVGFSIGLITVNSPMKRIFTPVLGLALLHGIAAYTLALMRSRNEPSKVDS